MVRFSEVIQVQTLYPRIYHACHGDHVRAASSGVQLSDRDSAILAHLLAPGLSSPSKLARHLKISAPTLSETLGRLTELGYVRIRRDEEDQRRQKIQLTPKGQEAMSRASVLDAARV